MRVKLWIKGVVLAVSLTSAWVYAKSDWPSGVMGGEGMMPGYGMMHGPDMGPNAMISRLDKKLEQLKSELNLTADQQQDWQQFESTVESQALSMNQHHQRMYKLLESGPSETLPERLQLHQQMRSELLANMNQLFEALTLLYQKLTPEQQKILDKFPLMGQM